MRNKKANINFFYSKSVLLLILILLLFNLHGHSAGNDYFPDINNPFHDVFYAYSNYNKGEAKKLLKKQFNRFFKNQAYINYGLIQEYEAHYPEAENYYRKALKNSEKISITYLYDLYRNHDREKSLPLLFALKNNINNCWIYYEIAVNYAENNDNLKALNYLSRAIDMGFSSTEMLLNDTAFDQMKVDYSFKKLIKKAGKKRDESGSIARRMKAAEYEFEKDKPYGMLNELQIAAYYENSGRYGKAMSILSSLIGSGLSFRDKSITLFWLARMNAKKGRQVAAKKYLNRFIGLIRGNETDSTGFKKLIAPIYTDVILNDRFLRNIGTDIIN